MKMTDFIIQRIKTIREERNLSQDELGKMMGRNGNYIRGIETGQKNVGILHVIKLCEVLNISPTEFFEDYTEM